MNYTTITCAALLLSITTTNAAGADVAKKNYECVASVDRSGVTARTTFELNYLRSFGFHSATTQIGEDKISLTSTLKILGRDAETRQEILVRQYNLELRDQNNVLVIRQNYSENSERLQDRIHLLTDALTPSGYVRVQANCVLKR